MNLWRDLPPGPDVPNVVYVVVEIPKGSRNKYEFDRKLGAIRLDRVLYSSMVYPGDYGFVPQTLYDDGDPLDIFVMTNEPTFPGCIIPARPIGLFRMKDKGEPDDKILAVPLDDPFFRDYHDISDIPQHFLAECAHFFATYKDLEGVFVKTLGWERAASAQTRITFGIDAYKKMFAEEKKKARRK
ncbi:MAG: inorganic diphosphatase [Chloroflexota bacterium]|nr:MAG: inorganic diphosphatase [Chloroflexota bacterium]